MDKTYGHGGCIKKLNVYNSNFVDTETFNVVCNVLGSHVPDQQLMTG